MGLGSNGEPLKNVNQHLRSINSSVSDMNNSGGGGGGAGILGAVPGGPALGGLGSALSGVVGGGVNVGAANLASLGALQNQLFGVNNLSELGNLAQLNPQLVANTLGSNALSALNASNMAAPMAAQTSHMSVQGGGGMNSYGRQDSQSGGGMFHGGGGSGVNLNRDFNSGGGARGGDYDTPSGNRSNYDMKSENDYRDDYRQQSNPLYSSVNNGAQRAGLSAAMSAALASKDNKYTSDTVIVTNVSLLYSN